MNRVKLLLSVTFFICTCCSDSLGVSLELVDFKKEYHVEFTSININPNESFLSQDSLRYPTLCSVLYDYSNTALIENNHPYPIGWLYYDSVASNDVFYYSSIKADRLDCLFVWNKRIRGAQYGAINYSICICPNGDIICVPRAETFNNRKNNPIIYKKGRYNSPIEVNVQAYNSDNCLVKPVGWFANSGVLALSSDDSYTVFFGEYTRPDVEPANIWKVKPPYEDPDNWIIAYSSKGKGEGSREVEHFHSINFDPFSRTIYAVSGDDAYESKIYKSGINGTSFSKAFGGEGTYDNRIKSRAINMVFTKEACYYGSDQVSFLIRAKRGENNEIDFSTVEIVKDSSGLSTIEPEKGYTAGEIYFSLLSDNPIGVLMLGYNGSPLQLGIQLHFYDINDNKFSVVSQLPVYGYHASGFRCDAASIYQSYEETRFVVGFGLMNNYNVIFDDVNPMKYHNLTLTLR